MIVIYLYSCVYLKGAVLFQIKHSSLSTPLLLSWNIMNLSLVLNTKSLEHHYEQLWKQSNENGPLVAPVLYPVPRTNVGGLKKGAQNETTNNAAA